MTESEISLGGQMSDDDELIRNRTELDNRKLATASEMVNERVKASSPIYRRRILSISLGSFMILITIALLFDRGLIYFWDKPYAIMILIFSIPLFKHKVCENPKQAIIYFLQQRPHKYSLLKRKVGNYWFAYEAELNYLEEIGQISYSYTGKKDTRVISLVDTES
jgi:hypothetical protein